MSDFVTAEQIAEFLEALAGPRRRARQDAAHDLAIVARKDSSLVLPHADALIDALFRPEAQTRWEALDALSELVADHADVVADAAEGAETSLFDESSATVRLSAFRFLSRLGATSAERSDEVWPLLDEAIQCYHGDAEYRDMLGCMLDFVRGDISDASRKALESRIDFDSKSGRGYIRVCSAEIIAASAEASKAK